MTSPARPLTLGLALVASLAFAPSARANFYVGNDTGVGTNNGHITLLVGHTNHFHRIGIFGGAVGRIPEASAGGPLVLTPGTGVMAGRYVSAPYDIPGNATSEYSNLEIRPINSLLGFADDAPETILINGGLRYLGSLAGSSLALELVSISSGLNVGTAAGVPLLANVGDRLALGDASSFAPFVPTFFTNVGGAPGAYTASFRLVDLNGLVGESGVFRYEFSALAVPEPASLALMGLGLGGVGLVEARRRRRAIPAPTA